MRRIDREMSAEFALNVFDTCEYATVSMLDEYDRPYAVPVSMIRIDDALYFHSAKEGMKTTCLKMHPHVYVSAVSWSHLVPGKFTTEYESACCWGMAEEILDDGEKIDILRELCEKYHPENMDEFYYAIERSLARTAIWKITIDSITGKRKRYDRSGKEMKFGRME